MKDKVIKEYLGDAVYVSIDEYGTLILTTDHHDPQEANNAIYLEHSVVNNLNDFIKRSGWNG